MMKTNTAKCCTQTEQESFPTSKEMVSGREKRSIVWCHWGYSYLHKVSVCSIASRACDIPCCSHPLPRHNTQSTQHYPSLSVILLLPIMTLPSCSPQTHAITSLKLPYIPVPLSPAYPLSHHTVLLLQMTPPLFLFAPGMVKRESNAS